MHQLSMSEVQEFGKYIDHSRGIYWVHLKLIKKNRKIIPCNCLDLIKLGSQWICLKISPDTRTLRATLHYGRRSRGCRFHQSDCQETKNLASRPFTEEAKGQRLLLFEMLTWQYFLTKVMGSRRKFGSDTNRKKLKLCSRGRQFFLKIKIKNWNELTVLVKQNKASFFIHAKGSPSIDWAPHPAAAFGDLITSQIKEYAFCSSAWIWGCSEICMKGKWWCVCLGYFSSVIGEIFGHNRLRS